MTAARDAVRPALPPELLGNDPQGFAWGVWHDRTPKLVGQVRDANPYGPGQRRALDDLLEEVTSGVIEPLGAHARDRVSWDSWGEAYYGKPWLDAPFLWAESYFYRRVLDAVAFFEPGPWHWFDPFGFLKAAELDKPDLEHALAVLTGTGDHGAAETGRVKLMASLWGNRADLGFQLQAGNGATGAEPGSIIADDSAALWAALGPNADVIVVADNAGRELVADLILIDHLLQDRLARLVSLHVKPWPYYVSDATAHDAAACLRRLAAMPGEPAAIADRLHAALATGTVSLYTDEFYCAPWSFHHTPPELAHQFEQATLAILKGDLNYRRLADDRTGPHHAVLRRGLLIPPVQSPSCGRSSPMSSPGWTRKP